MTSGPLVMILLDSLADAYVRRGDASYYCSRMAGGQYRPLESLFAFEGVMASALTGRWPDETGVFARFAYGPEQSVMRRNPLRALNLVDRHAYYANGERRDGRQNFILVKAVRKALRKWWITGGFNNLSPYGGVPLALADRFRYCMMLGAFDRLSSIGGFQTLFGRCEQTGAPKTFFYGDLPSARAHIQRLGGPEAFAFILVHTWTPHDLGGHEFGPEGEGLRAITRACDQDLRDFTGWMESAAPGASFVMFADHGMHAVQRSVDVTDIVEEAIDRKGPLVFVDSTAVRAWGSPDELARLAGRITARGGSRVLSEDELKRRHGWFPEGEYGQLFVAAEPGCIFVPDFFEGWKPRKGMHGYYDDTEWLRPSLLWFGPAFDGKPALEPRALPDVWKVADQALDSVLEGR